MSTRLLILLALAMAFGAIAPPLTRAQDLGTKIRRLFEPTPPPKKKKASTSAKKISSPSPSPKKKTTPTPSPKPSPSPSATPEVSPTSTAKNPPSASPKKKGKKSSPTPSPSPSVRPTPSPSTTAESSATPQETPTPSASPSPKAANASGATISPDEISGIEDYRPTVRKLIDAGLGLTTQNLDYKYGSADPSNGGLDCSGFVYYVLKQNGVQDVPRDASGQYAWVRKAGKFQAVISRNDDTFELEDLKPGDLLFWTGTYQVQKDPPITHAMIYLGREKKTNARLMVGASDGRTFHGESRYGVGVFDFRVSRPGGAREGRTPTFVGYGRIPGLGEG